MSDNGDWLENRKYVLKTLEGVQKDVHDFREETNRKINEILEAVTTLKVKSGLIGGFLGGLLTLIGSFVFKKFFD